MPVFHFDLVSQTTTVPDETGHECADLAEAREVADGLALRLIHREPELAGRGFAMSVKSDGRDELYRAEFDAILKLIAN